MNKLTEIKEAKEEYEAKGFMPHIESVGEIERVSCEFHNKAYDRISYLLSLLEEKDKALEETVTTLEEMVDEMAFLKSEFNVGDVIGTGLFSDADDLMDKAGDIIIKRNIARKALNTSSNQEGES